MAHVHKRLASTAARLARPTPPSVSVANLIAFPPPEAVFAQRRVDRYFDSDTWASLQPHHHRRSLRSHIGIGLGTVLAAPDAVLTACTHPSFLPLFAQHHPNQPLPETNGNLAALGNSLLGVFAAEWLHASYPHLPTRVLKAAVSAYVGPLTCASVAKEMGAPALLRWNRTPSTPFRPAVLHTDALSSVPRALTALVYTHRSLPTARKFAHAFFFSREVDLRAMMKFRDPKKALSETVRKFGRERPISRMLKETGRYSNSPVFVVGIYSGADKLGEGFGSSLKMAEFRAAEDALLRLYLTRTPSNLVQLPSSTFPATGSGAVHASIYDFSDAEGEEAGLSYVAPELGEQEVMYASSGRSSIIMPGDRDGDAPRSSDK